MTLKNIHKHSEENTVQGIIKQNQV